MSIAKIAAHLLVVAALVASSGLAKTDVASAGEAFVPPTLDVTISGVWSQPWTGGSWLVTVTGTVTNNAGVAFDESRKMGRDVTDLRVLHLI